MIGVRTSSRSGDEDLLRTMLPHSHASCRMPEPALLSAGTSFGFSGASVSRWYSQVFRGSTFVFDLTTEESLNDSIHEFGEEESPSAIVTAVFILKISSLKPFTQGNSKVNMHNKTIYIAHFVHRFS
jgi:hypothetical protein